MSIILINSYLKERDELLAYWKFSEAWNGVIQDNSNDPTHINLNEDVIGKASWRYIDQPFYDLASYDQVSGLITEPVHFTRTLVADTNVKLKEFEMLERMTLEFWVTLLIKNRCMQRKRVISITLNLMI